jgi:exodeoxyribonuclease-3
MKIVTWNVNSVRARLPRLLALLERHGPDVVCLQELKCQDQAFPAEPLEQAGYQAAVFGQKSYNGVAILARSTPEAVERGFPGDPLPEQARVVAADVEGVRFVDLYVVNGKTPDDPAFQIKLKWLDAVVAWLGQAHDPAVPLVLAGDFNIAPDQRDVHDVERWEGTVLFCDEVRQRLQAMLGWGLQDLQRVVSDEAGIYSWWDYRAGAFPRDHGLRIDLLLGTAPVAARCKAVTVDREERKKSSGEGAPSDHAPVIVELD